MILYQKPPDLNRLLITIRNAMERNSLVTETKSLKRKAFKAQEMIGESEPIKKIKETIEKVAPTEARVLITGENGVGKELVARWLHEKSNRVRWSNGGSKLCCHSKRINRKRIVWS